MRSDPVSMDGKLDCLYYPFSRLLDPTTLKYLLLIFDSISFLDEASSDWRRHLLEEMQANSPVFARFEELADDYGKLEERGVLRIVNPRELAAPNSAAVAVSILADLEDREITDLAARPERYGLPFVPSDQLHARRPSHPTWQIFESKMPDSLFRGTTAPK